MPAEQLAMTASQPSHALCRQTVGCRGGEPKHISLLLFAALFFSASLAAADPEVAESDSSERADAAEQRVETGSKGDSGADSAEQPEVLSERERMRQELMEMAEGLEAGEGIDHQALRERFRARQTARRGN